VSLTAADVAEIMRLVEQSAFDELTLEVNGTKLTLRRGAAAGAGDQVRGSVTATSAPSAASENTIVAIIEVMKLMNTVRAGVRGTVAEIFPGDGTLVEYDEPLLRIRKTG